MPFVQIIEFRTDRLSELDDLTRDWTAATEGKRTATRVTVAADRDQPGTFFHIVEFPDYEAAMANSTLPETGMFAERLVKLCDGPPTFRNLDVRDVVQL